MGKVIAENKERDFGHGEKTKSMIILENKNMDVLGNHGRHHLLFI